MGKFYRVISDADSRKFAYAISLYPDYETWDCSICGLRHAIIPDSFDVEVEKGWVYPDNLGCYFTSGVFAVSERVVDAWNEAGVTGFTAHKIGIHKVLTKALKKKTPQQYYHIVVNGRCDNDLKKMRLKIKKQCPQCGSRQFNKDILRTEGLYIDEKTWDGSDIFKSDLFRFKIFVTEKILKITYKYKFTNFNFYPEENAIYNIYKKETPKPINLDDMFND